MKWDESHESSDLEDRRGQAAPRSAGGGGGIGILFTLFRLFGWKGLVGGAVVLAVVYSLNGGGGGSSSSSSSSSSGGPPSQHRPAEENRLVRFVGFVFDDAQAYWEKDVPGFRHAKLVTYTGGTTTACGYGEAAVGPFYCPTDQKVYIDVSFYQELRDRFGAPGDFAQAYVIAHEVGHHVQRLSGSLSAHGSVATELQADCLAGVWAKSADKRGLLDVGDLNEALNAASSVGDDKIQQRETGHVRPETFTHGSAAERRASFLKGWNSGERSACGLGAR